MTCPVVENLEEILNMEPRCQYNDWEGSGCSNKVEWICSAHLACEERDGIFLCDPHHDEQISWDQRRNNVCPKCGSPGLMLNDRKI